MQQLRQQLEKAAVQSYRAYYDVEELPEGGLLKARCAYHSRSAQYVLVKKAELWAAVGRKLQGEGGGKSF